MALVLFYYAASSEVAWLFLLAYWVVAIIVASFFYARWFRGVTVKLTLLDLTHADGLPETPMLGDSAIEGDTGRLRLRLVGQRRTVGPAHAEGMVGGAGFAIAAGVVTREGDPEYREMPRLRRGPIAVSGWRFETSDPLGLFRRRTVGLGGEMALALPLFTSLRARPMVRDVEAAVTAPRAGSGTEIFGVREYRPGDPLRRIHWRSTARRGELIVREFEPPGVQNLGIFLDPSPVSVDAADQVARIAASEAWDCLRAGGRVTLWAPGCEPTRPDEQRNLLALLEWLARYPRAAADDEAAPMVTDAIAVTSTDDARLLEAVEDVRAHGGAVRGWAVGAVAVDTDIEMERAGLTWPL